MEKNGMTPLTAEKEKMPHDVRNCSIDIFRYIFALLVVVNHYDPFLDMNNGAILRFDHAVASLPVPFFAVVAGYYFTGKLLNGKRVLLPYLKRLIIPYAVWSAVYFTAAFVKTGGADTAGFIKNCAVRFLISGSEFHLWYFPAVMTAAVITAAFFRLRAEKLIVSVSCVMYAYILLQEDYSWLLPKLAAATAMPSAVRANYSLIALKRVLFITLPYFCAGYLVRKINTKNGFLCRNSGKALTAAGLLFVLEYILLTRKGADTDTTLMTYIVPAVLLLFLCGHPAADKREAAKSCRFLAGFTFYAHPAAYMAIDGMYRMAFHSAAPSALMYALICAVCALMAMAIKKINNRCLNMISC